MVKDGIVPVLPEIPHGRYLVDWLFEVGPTMATGTGSSPVTFGEIAAWQKQVGVELQPWEARGLRRLSQDYLSESHAATDPGRPPPSGKRLRNPSIDRQIDEAL